MTNNFQSVTKRSKIKGPKAPRNKLLQGKEEQYKLLFQNSPVPMWITDSKTLRFLEVNKAAVHTYGFTREEFLLMTLKDIHPKEDIAAFVVHYKKQSRKKLKELIEKVGTWRHVKKEGTIFPVNVTVGPVVFNGRKAMLAFAQDITERVELEKRKNEFIGIVSHELRAPLTVIKAYAQAIEKHTEESQKKVMYLFSNIDAQIEQMNMLIRDFLDESKIVAGTLILRRDWIDFDTMVTKTITDIKHLRDSHHIQKVGVVSKKVFADANRLGQVLVNLINNAMRCSQNGKKIIVHVTENAHSVTMCVQDFGIGVAKKQQKKIFEPFVQGSNVRVSFPSVGLGLYISSEIVKRHGGKMWVESKKGKGSKFYFTIPIAPPQQHSPKALQH